MRLLSLRALWPLPGKEGVFEEMERHQKSHNWPNFDLKMKDAYSKKGENFNTNHNCPWDDVFVFWVCLDPVVECNGV